MQTQSSMRAYMPLIPPTVKASWKDTNIFLTGPSTDVELAANGLLNYGIATAEESNTDEYGERRLITLTFYRKKLAGVVQNIAATGFLGSGEKNQIRRKHDGRKQNSIAKFHNGLENYKATRLPLVLQLLSKIKEEILERERVVGGKIGRGMDILLAEKEKSEK
jgi:hypothetical protein